MVYTQEEKEKMDALLQAFQPYIDRQERFDIVYSQKAGYLRIITGANCDTVYFPIKSFADMLGMLADDFLADEEARAGHYMKRDYDRVRDLLASRLDGLGDLREEADAILAGAFEACRARSETMYRQHLEEIRRLEDLLEQLRAAVV